MKKGGWGGVWGLGWWAGWPRGGGCGGCWEGRTHWRTGTWAQSRTLWGRCLGSEGARIGIFGYGIKRSPWGRCGDRPGWVQSTLELGAQALCR